jgi:chromosome segregation ATPase
MMKRNDGQSLFGRLKASWQAAEDDRQTELEEIFGLTPDQAVSEPRVPSHGPELEQAYRELLLENQMLRETNDQLGMALEQQDSLERYLQQTENLIIAQRNALAERARRMRETEFENKGLLRAQRKLKEQESELQARLQRQVKEARVLRERLKASTGTLELARDELRAKEAELAKLTDRYYQLEAALEKFGDHHDSAASR